MFPVAELSDLNSDDFSFLDDVCLLEDNLLSENKNMANFNLIEEISYPETNILSEDWLSGNVQLDDLTGNLGFHHQPEELNQILYPVYSGVSHSICSSSIDESSTDVFGASSSVDDPIQSEMVSYEDIYQSSDEARVQLDIQNTQSPLPSESGEASEGHVKDDEYNLAAKKYLKMRQKNNIASRHSRKLRKEKNVEMVERLKKLEIENKQLSLLATELERQRDALQKQLLQAISKK